MTGLARCPVVPDAGRENLPTDRSIMRQTVAAALGLAAALTLALTACGGDAASSASSTAAAVSSTSAAVSGAPTSAAATTAEGTESPPADAPPAGGGDYSITFAVAGAPQDVTVTECVSDPMTQSFTMTGTEGPTGTAPVLPAHALRGQPGGGAAPGQRRDLPVGRVRPCCSRRVPTRRPRARPPSASRASSRSPRRTRWIRGELRSP